MLCLAAPVTLQAAVREAGGASCALDPVAASRILVSGDTITVADDGGRCVLTAGRLTGRELIALGMQIDLNAATAADLEALPGIGPALAARIVEHRNEKGPFNSPEALMDVKGIGPAIYARIKDKIIVLGR